jgi:glycerophosphoryl diester phosphodiesterase
VPAGLTIGGDLAGSARYLLRRTTRRTRSRLDDVTGAGASWAVIGKRAASAALLAGSRSRGLRTMIWTVDADRELRHWLASPDLDVLVTDRPGAAVRLRGQAARQPAS